jgi:hypothetical protein
MNLGQAETVARAARASVWFASLAGFAGSLRQSVRTSGQLLVVGSPDAEPWHFTAHLESLAHYRGAPELTPTLVRWVEPTGSAPGIGVEQMTAGGAGRVILAISEGSSDGELLERLATARHRGATILGLSGDRSSTLGDLACVSHESHTVQSGQTVSVGRLPVLCDFDLASHLIGVNAVSGHAVSSRWRPWRSGSASRP